MIESSLVWRCRRGMREMDLLLQRFVEQHYDTLPASEQQHFRQLLDETDLDIMDWIMDRREPPTAFSQIIEKLRTTNTRDTKIN